MAKRVSIQRRFEGPPGSSNGGYVAGLLAEHLGEPGERAHGIEVSLRAPVPLETPLALVPAVDGGLHLEHGGVVVAEGRPAALALELPPAPALGEARAAGKRAAYPDHPFPGCFVCGPERAAGDGLRILTGPLSSRQGDAALWTPDASLAGADGRVDPRFVWAALDCPGGMTAMANAHAPMVLGRMTGRVLRRLAVGEVCAVMGWVLRAEGRKHFTGTALFDAHGRLVGCSEQIWIEVRG